MEEIKFNGFITSYDPDELNITQTDLTTDLSPGIYISSSLSQITNPLASDFANKTRSFSSDFNPWSAQPDANKLLTDSLNVIFSIIFSYSFTLPNFFNVSLVSLTKSATLFFFLPIVELSKR